MKPPPPPWLNTDAKPGDACPLCGKGQLAASATGKQLVCPICARTVIVVPVRPLIRKTRAKLRKINLRGGARPAERKRSPKAER